MRKGKKQWVFIHMLQGARRGGKRWEKRERVL